MVAGPRLLEFKTAFHWPQLYIYFRRLLKEQMASEATGQGCLGLCSPNLPRGDWGFQGWGAREEGEGGKGQALLTQFHFYLPFFFFLGFRERFEKWVLVLKTLNELQSPILFNLSHSAVEAGCRKQQELFDTHGKSCTALSLTWLPLKCPVTCPTHKLNKQTFVQQNPPP